MSPLTQQLAMASPKSDKQCPTVASKPSAAKVENTYATQCTKRLCLVVYPMQRPQQPHGKAGTSTETSVSDIASGPVGLTISLVGATVMRAGAMLSPCMHPDISHKLICPKHPLSMKTALACDTAVATLLHKSCSCCDWGKQSAYVVLGIVT